MCINVFSIKHCGQPRPLLVLRRPSVVEWMPVGAPIHAPSTRAAWITSPRSFVGVIVECPDCVTPGAGQRNPPHAAHMEVRQMNAVEPLSRVFSSGGWWPTRSSLAGEQDWREHYCTHLQETDSMQEWVHVSLHTTRPLRSARSITHRCGQRSTPAEP